MEKLKKIYILWKVVFNWVTFVDLRYCSTRCKTVDSLAQICSECTKLPCRVITHAPSKRPANPDKIKIDLITTTHLEAKT